MKLPLVQNQQGAVLAFSLVMLLLLTLVSVNMIQQNKAQIAMTGNNIQQTTAFSIVGNALSSGQSQIDTRRTLDSTAHTCNVWDSTSTGISPNWSLTYTAGSNVAGKVTEVYCLYNYNSTTQTGNLEQCKYDTSGSPIVINTPMNACARLKNDGKTSVTSASQLCNTEVYTIQISYLDSTTGSKRTIESKYQVNCAGGITTP